MWLVEFVLSVQLSITCTSMSSQDGAKMQQAGRSLPNCLRIGYKSKDYQLLMFVTSMTMSNDMATGLKKNAISIDERQQNSAFSFRCVHKRKCRCLEGM